jgi:inosine-uridine nucleoside N-ribohydrolase
MPYNRKQGHAVKEDGKVAFLYDVPDYKKIRVILDTDAACEADDPFAIVQALLSPKLMVKGILAEHFREQGSMEKSYQEILTILDCMGMDASLAHRGQEGPMDTSGVKQETCDAQKNFPELSEGVKFLIEEAMKEDERPLYVLCQGAITNVAVAMQACPEIIQRMTVIWIGTHGEAPHPAPFREFNAGNDITAANLVLSCGGDIWIVPSTVYTTILIGIAEIQKRILPCGKIGEHLFWNLVNYNNSEGAGWTKGESWSLGDSPAIALALNPDCGHFHYVPAPVVAEDTSSVAWLATEDAKGQKEMQADKKEAAQDGKPDARPMVKMYTDVDSRYILEDLIAKLELFCEQ